MLKSSLTSSRTGLEEFQLKLMKTLEKDKLREQILLIFLFISQTKLVNSLIKFKMTVFKRQI